MQSVQVLTEAGLLIQTVADFCISNLCKKKYASTSVITVEKYLLVATFLYNGRLSISVSSSIKNSWKESLPTRATESRDVNANADTAKVDQCKYKRMR